MAPSWATAADGSIPDVYNTPAHCNRARSPDFSAFLMALSLRFSSSRLRMSFSSCFTPASHAAYLFASDGQHTIPETMQKDFDNSSRQPNANICMHQIKNCIGDPLRTMHAVSLHGRNTCITRISVITCRSVPSTDDSALMVCLAFHPVDPRLLCCLYAGFFVLCVQDGQHACQTYTYCLSCILHMLHTYAYAYGVNRAYRDNPILHGVLQAYQGP